ncbi:MAG: T9SS type A sorting domain-containing protein [Bacteroidia bacterium]|nr:T9SS type A sorting domain-containing protein [Bacteroidia bacterium]
MNDWHIDSTANIFALAKAIYRIPMKTHLTFLVLFVTSFWISATAQNSIYIHNGASFQTHSGSLVSNWGPIHNNGNLGEKNNVNRGKWYFLGSSAYTISGDSSIQIDSLIINSGGQITVQLQLKVRSHADFTKGILVTDRSDSNTYFVHFLNNSAHSNASDSSHVNGTIQKTGNNTFQFPVGDSSNLQVIAISAPGASTDRFLAYYLQRNPSAFNKSTTAIDSNCGGSKVVVDISEKEFWILNRVNGSSNVQVSLSYDNYSQVNTPSQLMVARWNGSAWESKGNGGNTGTTANGTVTTGDGCGSSGSPTVVNTFGAFTFSGSSATTLPVDWVSFKAKKLNTSNALLSWSTSAQVHNSHFEVERSIDGIQFHTIGVVAGEGYSQQIDSYQFIDGSPAKGMNYYRIKQVDFDGQWDVTPTRKLRFGTSLQTIKVYPNPTHDIIYIQPADRETPVHYELIDQSGKTVFESHSDLSTYTIDMHDMSTGVYVLLVDSSPYRIIKN